MEIIRKKISLESARSRQQGLLPYIPFNSGDDKCPYVEVDKENNNGNYGGFVVNFKEKDSQEPFIIYKDLLRKYHTIINSLLAGTKVKRVNKGGEFKWAKYLKDDLDLYDIKPADIAYFKQESDYLYAYLGEEDYSGETYLNLVENYETLKEYGDIFEICKTVDELIGKLYIPKEILGSKVPEWINLCDITGWIEWLESFKNGTCCDKKLYEQRGGDEMLSFLNRHKNDYSEAISKISDTYEFTEPTISVPIFLPNNIAPIGLMESYIDEDFDYSYSGENKSIYEEELSGYVVESKLESLRTGKLVYDDNGKPIPGILKKANENTFAKYENGEWISYEDSGITEGYETILLLNAIPESTPTNVIFKVIYENGEDIPTDLPYKINVPKNTYLLVSGDTESTFIGDFILDISNSGNIIDFTYVIGGEFTAKKDTTQEGSTGYKFENYIEGTGIIYHEQGELLEGVDYFSLDYIENVPIYYQYVSFDKNGRIIESEDYNASRTTFDSNIVSMSKMYEYDVDKDILMTTSVFKPDYFLGITKDIQSKVDIMVSRGNAAAFERHLQLIECNTLEDLENYKNNKFDL